MFEVDVNAHHHRALCPLCGRMVEDDEVQAGYGCIQLIDLASPRSKLEPLGLRTPAELEETLAQIRGDDRLDLTASYVTRLVPETGRIQFVLGGPEEGMRALIDLEPDGFVTIRGEPRSL
jgi:hypothetical protein